MQLGVGSSFSKISSNGFCNINTPLKKFTCRSMEGRESTLSQPSGTPASAFGNWTCRTWMWDPDWISRSMVVLNRMALRGVVTMVTCTFRRANNLAMSTMGRRWPGAIKGMNTKWSWLWTDGSITTLFFCVRGRSEDGRIFKWEFEVILNASAAL